MSSFAKLLAARQEQAEKEKDLVAKRKAEEEARVKREREEKLQREAAEEERQRQLRQLARQREQEELERSARLAAEREQTEKQVEEQYKRQLLESVRGGGLKTKLVANGESSAQRRHPAASQNGRSSTGSSVASSSKSAATTASTPRTQSNSTAGFKTSRSQAEGKGKAPILTRRERERIREEMEFGIIKGRKSKTTGTGVSEEDLVHRAAGIAHKSKDDSSPGEKNSVLIPGAKRDSRTGPLAKIRSSSNAASPKKTSAMPNHPDLPRAPSSKATPARVKLPGSAGSSATTTALGGQRKDRRSVMEIQRELDKDHSTNLIAKPRQTIVAGRDPDSGKIVRKAPDSIGNLIKKPEAKKRRPTPDSDLDSDDLDDDSPPPPKKKKAGGSILERAGLDVWKMFGRDKGRDHYLSQDIYSDDDMEASAEQIEREERRAARLAREADRREEELERKRAEEKRKKKMGGKSGKA